MDTEVDADCVSRLPPFRTERGKDGAPLSADGERTISPWYSALSHVSKTATRAVSHGQVERLNLLPSRHLPRQKERFGILTFTA